MKQQTNQPGNQGFTRCPGVLSGVLCRTQPKLANLCLLAVACSWLLLLLSRSLSLFQPTKTKQSHHQSSPITHHHPSHFTIAISLISLTDSLTDPAIFHLRTQVRVTNTMTPRTAVQVEYQCMELSFRNEVEFALFVGSVSVYCYALGQQQHHITMDFTV